MPVSVTSRSTQLLAIYAVCVHKFLPLVRAHPLIDRPVTHLRTLNPLAMMQTKGKLNRAHRRASIEARGRAFDISSFSQASKIPPFSLFQSTSSPSRICLDVRYPTKPTTTRSRRCSGKSSCSSAYNVGSFRVTLADFTANLSNSARSSSRLSTRARIVAAVFIIY